MNTLHTSQPASVSTESTRVALPPSRPSALDRAAMRLGLWLLLWGQRRSRRHLGADAHHRRILAEQVRREYDRTLAHAAGTMPIR